MSSQDPLAEANRGIVGITEDLQVFGGYDEEFDFAHANATRPDWMGAEDWRPLTQAEKVELAKQMIDRWTRYQAAALA